MTELLTAAQMRAIEQAAIASGDVTGLELMERAGRGVVEAIFEEWPELAKTSHRAVVLCGPGNNGGDGFVVARLLKEWGWEVEVFLWGDPERLPPDAKVNYERWTGIGSVHRWDASRIATSGPAFYVDAIFGAGQDRAPAAEIMAPLAELHVAGHTYGRLVAIDAPTGLCIDSGAAFSTEFGAVAAFLTVTFHAARPGHYLREGPHYSGRIRVRDIGLPRVSKSPAWLQQVSVSASAVDKLPERDGEKWLPVFLVNHAIPEKLARDDVSIKHHPAPGAHKYTHGHALILSGPPGQTGAARLAARAALRIGAGVVTLACPPEAIPENAARLDAIMLKPVADADALTRILADTRINALCLGPGLGTGGREAGLVAAALRDGGVEPRPTVLDADALTLLARDKALFALLHKDCVLTPHAGEFARLFPDLAEKLTAPATKGPAYSKVDATREAAARAGCTVLFKGPDTVIADPSGRASINSAHYDRAAPWLATAGSGDVLAGFITGLLARGFAPMQAAETAAWLHVEAARSFGPGLIAEDLPEELPKVFRALGL